ncbi:TfoX/Sxy family protein [Nocardia vinacea]|uniref:TfoX/Sxy family protein n=1 Tax=Nocardia vinacea TaxID=96468 RepID=A0ABZ1YZ76_9NOCA|nr:TfoX/Sxy family protein [Nocardia vinacea]WSF90387.1 TfoX/Sxy family protein [Nocardia vinacea]
MAYDKVLADRIRELIDPTPDVSEKKMFGGLAFLINGNMAVAASRTGGLLVRVDPEESTTLLAREYVGAMVMGGREMNNWLRVDGAAVADDEALDEWIDRGISYARSLPPKEK